MTVTAHIEMIRKRDDVKNVLATVRQIVPFLCNSNLAYEPLKKYPCSLDEICRISFSSVRIYFSSDLTERQLIYDVSTRNRLKRI